MTACLDDLPGGDDDNLLVEAGGTSYTPDKMIRVANVNLFKGSFGEEKTDSRNFLHYLAHGKYVPDIFTVQNLNHNGGGYHDCADVARKLEKYLEPKTVNYELYYPSTHGGACVLYRASRFERTDAARGLGAWHGEGCSKQGMESVGVRLRDKKFHNATVSVISVHMPGECTTKNSRELRAWVNAARSDVRIIAGDFNTNTGPGWGSIPNMKEVFGSNGFKTADVWGPLDWIWRKGQSNVANQTRVEYADAKAVNASMNYSDHRGGFEDLTYQPVDAKTGALMKEAELPEQDSAPDDMPAPPAACDNDCWRAALGVYTYDFPTTSNPNDPRLARIIFDRRFYINAYPDVLAWAQGKVATQGGTIYEHGEWHWLNRGIAEGRMGAPTFDSVAYMNWHADVSAAYGWNNYNGAINHYITFGRFEGRRASVFFDPASYKARYGDIAGGANWAVVDHFANHGMDEGRQGSADFAPAWYLGANSDVQSAWGTNYYRGGMIHWVRSGRSEGRRGAP